MHWLKYNTTIEKYITKIGIPTVLNSSDQDVLSDRISLDPRIELEFILKLKIKRNDLMLVDTCQTLSAGHWQI